MTYASRETYKRVSEPGRPEIEPFPFTLARDIRPNLISSDIVKDLIPRNAFGEVHADSAGGKTAIIVDLLIHVAAGLPYRGRRVEAQPVVFVALEGHAGIDNRIFGAMAEIGIEPDIALALVKVTDNFRQAQAAQRTAAVAHMLQKLYGGDCPVVAIDTYQAALGNGGSDCDPRDVSAFISNVQAHLLGTGFTVLVLHHFGKDASRGGRGWSGLRAALDFELEIERDDDQRTMRVTKSRDGSDSQPVFCYRFEGREVGINDHGEPVTAVVVHHLADQTSPKPGRRLTPKARAALNNCGSVSRTGPARSP